jgi:perosamine synthetase
MIPLFRPSCSDLEVGYVTAALRSGWWGMGPRVAALEDKFAAWAGVKHAVAVNSGTAALQLALEAAGVTCGDVIVPALTFASTALAPLHAGCRVVFADVDEDTLCIDWADAANKVTPETRAVIPVWYGGTVTRIPWGLEPAFLDTVIVEDCAHAAGSVGTGRLGAGCWSFHAVKNIAAGDGGMITTDDPRLAARARALRWCGIDRSTWDRDQGAYGWDYDITAPGYKMHMNDLTAALALAQLERLPGLNKARAHRAGQYLDALAGLPWLRLPHWSDETSWHLFPVRTRHRDALVDHLLAEGVSAGVHYKPLSSYPVFGGQQPLPVTDRVWRELVTLPLYPDMTDDDHAAVVAAVKGFPG